MSAVAERLPPGLDVACHLNVLLADPGSDLIASALDAIAARGFRRVVLAPVDADAFDAAGFRRLCEARGLTAIPIAGQSPGADVSSSDPQVRAAGIAALRRMVGLAAALGSDQLNGVPYGLFGRAPSAAPVDAWRRSAAAVGEVADEAHERGVAMVFEVLNRYETALVNTADQAMAYAEASGSPHLRIHLDTFHMAVEEDDLAGAIRTALPRLAFLELGQSGRGALSRGAVDVADVVRGALDAGYEGRWGVEAFTAAILPEPARDALAIWREPYRDGVHLTDDAVRVIRAGWASSTVGRRAARLSRAQVPTVGTAP
ncbi:sugar phosphate isomerase/epimerase family protein [Microbacterium marinilacus]|uniref:Sugar phosphate isomerase/epimerase n=1 Tax=Microbacterium marinilacus TaxID=415209 RepID=A0ABP7B9P6_9MICO|nr:sugar phosphate isomerase/epimerase family protein [Microbacterium marinilacus]MBY0687096.1 sugar phosphate isomerase/epimerase [Microbacterium marinilacus]